MVRTGVQYISKKKHSFWVETSCYTDVLWYQVAVEALRSQSDCTFSITNVHRFAGLNFLAGSNFGPASVWSRLIVAGQYNKTKSVNSKNWINSVIGYTSTSTEWQNLSKFSTLESSTVCSLSEHSSSYVSVFFWVILNSLWIMQRPDTTVKLFCKGLMGNKWPHRKQHSDTGHACPNSALTCPSPLRHAPSRESEGPEGGKETARLQ